MTADTARLLLDGLAIAVDGGEHIPGLRANAGSIICVEDCQSAGPDPADSLSVALGHLHDCCADTPGIAGACEVAWSLFEAACALNDLGDDPAAAYVSAAVAHTAAAAVIKTIDEKRFSGLTEDFDTIRAALDAVGAAHLPPGRVPVAWAFAAQRMPTEVGRNPIKAARTSCGYVVVCGGLSTPEAAIAARVAGYVVDDDPDAHLRLATVAALVNSGDEITDEVVAAARAIGA